MTNKQLAHELLLDPAYRLPVGVGQEDDTGDVADVVEAAMRDSFWSSVEDDLRATPPRYTCVLRVLVTAWRQSRGGGGGGGRGVGGRKSHSAAGRAGPLRLVRLHGAGCCRRRPSRSGAEGGRRAEAEWAGLRAGLEAAWADAAAQPAALCRGLRFLLARANAARVDAGNARLTRLAQLIQQHGA